MNASPKPQRVSPTADSHDQQRNIIMTEDVAYRHGRGMVIEPESRPAPQIRAPVVSYIPNAQLPGPSVVENTYEASSASEKVRKMQRKGQRKDPFASEEENEETKGEEPGPRWPRVKKKPHDSPFRRYGMVPERTPHC
jgi:hypothetical protein